MRQKKRDSETFARIKRKNFLEYRKDDGLEGVDELLGGGYGAGVPPEGGDGMEVLIRAAMASKR